MTSLPTDPVLAALLSEEEPPDKQNEYRQNSRQINQAPPEERASAAPDSALAAAIANALRARQGRKEIRTPRTATLAEFEKAGGRERSGMYWRVRRHVGRLAFRLINDLMRSGIEKPSEAELAAALEDYIWRAMSRHIMSFSSSHQGTSKFERWSTLSSTGVERIALSQAKAALAHWNDGYIEIQRIRGRAGGTRSRRPREYTDADVDLVAGCIEWTVAEHAKALGGRYSPRTVERIRADARALLTPAQAPATTSDETDTARISGQLTQSEERVWEARRRRELEEAEREHTRELEEAGLMEWQLVRDSRKVAARLHASSPRPDFSGFEDLLNS